MQIKRVSPWQTLFRYFPGSMAEDESCVVKVRSIRGVKQPDSMHLLVREEVARRIGQLEMRSTKHSLALSARAGKRIFRAAGGEVEGDDALFAAAAELKASIFGNDDLVRAGEKGGERSFDIDNFLSEEAQPEEGQPTILYKKVHPGEPTLLPDQISLIDVSDAQVQLEVYPLTFRCPRCGLLELANPNSGSVPSCSQCYTCEQCHRTYDAVKGVKCPHCSGSKVQQTQMRQLSLVEVCSRCARVRPVFPHALLRRLEDWVGKKLFCPKCKHGNIRLKRGYSLNEARFACTRNCGYETWESDLGGTCPYCSIQGDKNNPEDKGDVAFLKPTAAMASSNLAPLVETFLFLGSDNATLESLRTSFAAENKGGKGGWQLSRLLDGTSAFNKADAVREIYAVNDAFRLANIQTLTVNYGYWSRAQEHRRPFKEHERMHQFYRTDRRYDAFFVETDGHGLVIELNRERLLKVVNMMTGQNYANYEEMADRAMFQLQGDNPDGQIPFQDLIDRDALPQYPELALAQLLHSLEHAVLSQAEAQVGLQIFGSKILIRDATLVLFEQEDVGEGGIEQMVEGTGFLKLMRAVRWALTVCSQGCDDACPACNYVEDTNCRPFVPHEFGPAGIRWIPPNALLNRELARMYMEEEHD